MEQQTVSVAKAGLISVLNARTSVLAAANPKGSKYDPGMSLTENINLPPSLLSRFDLVYLVQDEQDERRDAQLAEHLVAMFYSDDDRKARAHQQVGGEGRTVGRTVGRTGCAACGGEGSRAEDWVCGLWW
jgi:DNA replication licensing factor MCM4